MDDEQKAVLKAELRRMARQYGPYATQDAMRGLSTISGDDMAKAVDIVRADPMFFTESRKIPAIKSLREENPFLGLLAAKLLIEYAENVISAEFALLAEFRNRDIQFER